MLLCFCPFPSILSLSTSLSLSRLLIIIINVLVEDWFSVVQHRIFVVPCPHCSNGLPPGPGPGPGPIPSLQSSHLIPSFTLQMKIEVILLLYCALL